MLGLSPFWWPEKPPELPEEVENRWSSEFADDFVLVPVVDGVATDSDGDSGVGCDDEDAGGEEAANHSCRTASSGVSRLTGSHLRIRKRIPLINYFVFFFSKAATTENAKPTDPTPFPDESTPSNGSQMPSITCVMI
jgi:hypothetical protein